MVETVVMPIKNENEKFCSDCAAVINKKAEICPKCGVRQLASPYTSPLSVTTNNGKNKVAAALLAFFLGGFGVHKFYLGYVGSGILYLLFFWTFIPAIIAFIEGILYITMSDENFNNKYGNR